MVQAAANHSESTGGQWAARFSNWFFPATAALLGALGLVMVLAAFDDELLGHERLLRQEDPVLGMSTGAVLKLAGLLHLGLCGFLFLGRNPLSKALVVIWVASVFGIYRLGFGWLHGGASFSVVTLCADKCGLKPGFFGTGWELLLAGMTLGALLQLGLEWRSRKQLQKAQFVKDWREFREKGTAPPPGDKTG